MKRALVVVLLLLSCKHVRVAAKDYTNGVFKVCGTNFARVEDLNEEANKQCNVPANLLRCGEQVTGSSTYAYGYGNSAMATTSATLGLCCEYHCP
jgi:hypothetical protein